MAKRASESTPARTRWASERREAAEPGAERFAISRNSATASNFYFDSKAAKKSSSLIIPNSESDSKKGPKSR